MSTKPILFWCKPRSDIALHLERSGDDFLVADTNCNDELQKLYKIQRDTPIFDRFPIAASIIAISSITWLRSIAAATSSASKPAATCCKPCRTRGWRARRRKSCRHQTNRKLRRRTAAARPRLVSLESGNHGAACNPDVRRDAGRHPRSAEQPPGCGADPRGSVRPTLCLSPRQRVESFSSIAGQLNVVARKRRAY